MRLCSFIYSPQFHLVIPKVLALTLLRFHLIFLVEFLFAQLQIFYVSIYLTPLYRKSQALRHNIMLSQLSQQIDPLGFRFISYASTYEVDFPQTELSGYSVLIIYSPHQIN